jgi:hypothetical protein
MTQSLFRSFLLIVFLTSLLCWLSLPLRAGAIIDGDGADGNVTSSTVSNTEYYHLYTLLAGTLFYGDNGAVVEGFALPYLAPGQTITSATVSFYLESNTSQGTPSYNLQLYGLKRVNTTSGAPLVADWYVGANDTANTLLDSSFITPSTTLNSTVSYTGANLASFVNTQYANAAFSGMQLSNSRYIFFRLSANANVQNNGFSNYTIGSARNPNRIHHPMLALTISGGISNIASVVQFSFNLPQNSITSAGVYNSSTGVLMRTLWNNVQYQEGTNYGVWDGKDDNGNALPTGSNYQIKLIYHNVQYVWEGMIGNTSLAQSGPNVFRSFDKLHDMTFSGSTGFYTVGYNELECPFHNFTVGSPQVPMDYNLGYGFVDANSAFYYVTSDASRTYWAKVYGGADGSDTYVIGMNNGNPGTFYTFPKGTVPAGANQHYPSCIDYDTTANQANPASGLAVQKSGSYLFVSHSNLNVVRVFDKVQGNMVGSFTVANPGRVATTANGDVWVISGGTTPSVLRYTFANGAATLDRTITGFSNPAGVGVSADDSLLLVADGGASQQIKAYVNATGASAWTYGTLGGNAVNGPDVTTNTFDFSTQRANFNDFSNQAFIAFQPDNTFWVEDGGNSRVMHYGISGTTLTYIEQISYNDASYRTAVDLTDTTRVFNTFYEYSVNYALPPGGTNGSWKMVKNWAVGLPNDSNHLYYGTSNGLINVVTLSNGRTYGFLNNFTSNNWDLFELPASGPARFTGYSYDNNPLIYADGSLRFTMVNEAMTAMSSYSQPLTGFDSSNNPTWGSPTLIASTQLTSANPIPWNAFPTRTEITAGGKLVDFGANSVNAGYHLGGIALGGTTFNWQASPSVNSPPWFPQDGRFDIGNGVQYAGNYAEALGRNIIYGYHGEFWSGGEASQWVNYLDNGLMVGRFGTYANSTTGGVAIDGFAGNSFAWTLVTGPNGNNYLYHNDESDHGGTVRWRIDGWAGITELDGTSSIGSIVSLSSSTAGPSVTITSPLTGTVDSNGSSLTLSAQAASSGASIASVQFFDGSTSLGTDSAAPFSMNVSGLTTGAHVITAKATDSNGLSTTSAPVNIRVGGDGTNAPPPAPVSLSSSTVSAQSVTLNWLQPTVGTTSSTIGQIIGFQCDTTTDSNALKTTDVAGAPNYSEANFNIFGQASTTTGPTVINALNSAGTTIPNLGLYAGVSPSNSTNSTQSLTGTTKKIFSGEVSTFSPGISLRNVPFELYDLVVYSLPANISTGTQTGSVTVTEGLNSSTVQQTFNALPTGYTVSDVPFGSNSSVSNSDTIVFQGLTSPFFAITGNNIAGFQIVERPYDQGTPSSYTIQRATASGAFVTVGTASAGATTFTDTSSLSSSTTYQYRIQAVNGAGASAYSNIISVTTPAGSTASSGGFTSWLSEYFTAAQLADPTISGPTADPYGSGVPNLLAYALQLNPATARPTDVPSPVISNGHLTVTYLVPSSITDITYIVEVSSDLVNWNSGTGYTDVVSSIPGPTGTTITVQDTLPAATQKHFMRLRVTQN